MDTTGARQVFGSGRSSRGVVGAQGVWRHASGAVNAGSIGRGVAGRSGGIPSAENEPDFLALAEPGTMVLHTGF